MKTQFLKFAAIVILISGLSTLAFADQTRPVSGFTSIASSGAFNIMVKIDGTESLKLNAPENIMDKIETVVESGVLKINYKYENSWNNHNEKVDIYITAKSLTSLINSGSGNIIVESTISASKFKAILSGSGTITTSVKAEDLSAVISGSGNINLNGNTNDAKVVITGSGNINCKDLKTQSTSITISGSGNVYIAAEQELSTRIIGSGSVKYSGNANVSTTKVGSGSVIRVN